MEEHSDEDVFILIGFFFELAGWNNFLWDLFGGWRVSVMIFAAALALLSLDDFFLLLFLLVILSFLQAHEIFTIDLVELILDVVNDLSDTGDEDELERVHTSVGHLESLIKCHELRLQSRNLDQDFEELSELLSGVLDGLSTHGETEESGITDLIDILELEDGDLHTSNII